MRNSLFIGATLDNPSYVDDAFRGAKALAGWLGSGHRTRDLMVFARATGLRKSNTRTGLC
jgi:hypothetical protein